MWEGGIYRCGAKVQPRGKLRPREEDEVNR